MKIISTSSQVTVHAQKNIPKTIAMQDLTLRAITVTKKHTLK